MITGASGFLGGAVARLLLELGAEVHGTGRGRLPPEGVVAHPMNLPEDAERVIRAIRPAVVFHLAGPVDLRRDPELYDRLRAPILDGTVAVTRACLAIGSRLVHTGTCEEYGTAPAPFREDMAPEPVSPYSALKAAATAWVIGTTRVTELQATVVRPFRGYGPGDRASVIASAARAALQREPFPMTDGAQAREWNHIDALAEGMVAAGAHPGALGKVLNLGGGERRSVREVVELVFRLAGADPGLVLVGALPRRAGEIEALFGDHARARGLWGEIPQPALEEGLSDALDWIVTEDMA